MARKKRREEKGINQPFPLRPPSKNTPPMTDPAMLERHIQARELLLLVDPTENPALAIEAAKKAIELCNECMEAHMRLGELESNPEKVVIHYQQASEAGSWMIHALDEDDLDKNPLRAAYVYFRIQMSDHLWSIGQRVEAIEHLTDVFKHDHEDMLETATRLLFRLVDLGWDREFEECVDDGAFVGNTAGNLLLEAMVKYRDEQNQDSAKEAIQIAESIDPLLFEFLIGKTPIPLQSDALNEYAECDDSIRLAHLILPTARSLPGFLRWVRENTQIPHEPTSPKRSHRQILDALLDLEQVDETWIVDCRRVAGSWIFLAFVQGEADPIRIESLAEKPSDAILWELVHETMFDPRGMPRRPTRLGVAKKSLVKAWDKRCQSLGIACTFNEFDGIPERLFDEFTQVLERVDWNVEFTDDLWESLAELPQYDRSWVLGAFQPPLWITDGATPRRPWVALVLDVESGMILMQEISDEPDEELALKTAVKAMMESMTKAIPPHRPSKIYVHRGTDSERIRDQLGALEIEVASANDEAEQVIEECLEGLIRQVGGPENRQALLDAEGITPAEMASLYQSAARFWKMAPWRLVGGDRPIEIRSPVFDQAWYAVIVGQLGMNLGVVLYDQLDVVENVMTSNEDVVEPDGIFLNYLEKFEIPSIDLWNQEKFGWSIASEEAYLLIERALPQLKHRRPNRSELLALDVVLRILPAFVTRPQTDEAFTLAVESFEHRTQAVARWL